MKTNVKIRFCPRCTIEYSAEADVCVECMVALKPILYCEGCREMLRLEVSNCPGCGGELAPLAAARAEEIIEESGRPHFYRYVVSIIVLFVAGVFVPRQFGLPGSFFIVGLMTLAGYLIGTALDRQKERSGSTRAIEEDLNEHIREVDKELEEDNIIICENCGEELNVYTRKGIRISDSQPWRLFCAYCGMELEVHDF